MCHEGPSLLKLRATTRVAALVAKRVVGWVLGNWRDGDSHSLMHASSSSRREEARNPTDRSRSRPTTVRRWHERKILYG